MLWYPKRREAGIIPDALSPIVIKVTHRMVALRWSQPACDVGSEPVAYEIEMSHGAASDDYEVIAETRGNVLAYTHHGLESGSAYRFRIRGVARSEGGGYYSAPVLVETSPSPENVWMEMYPALRTSLRQRGIDRKAQDDPSKVFEGKPKDGWYDFPSPRSGQTAAWISGHVYVFGGMRAGRSCDDGLHAKCTNPAMGDSCIVDWGTGNELWRFDTETHVWDVMESEGAIPAARMKHTAVAFGRRMYTFAGMDSIPVDSTWSAAGNASTVYDDFWEMDPGIFGRLFVHNVRSYGIYLRGSIRFRVSTSIRHSSPTMTRCA